MNLVQNEVVKGQVVNLLRVAAEGTVDAAVRYNMQEQACMSRLSAFLSLEA